MWTTLLGFVFLLSLQVPTGQPVDGGGQTDYRVGQGDILRITVFGEAELSGQYSVEADGTFDFPLLGRLTIEDPTLRTIEEELERLLGDGYLRSPRVTVEVARFRTRSIFVIGEVRSPGRYELSGDTALLGALAQAGSTTAAAGSEVLIIHASPGQATTPALPDQEESQDITRVNLTALQTGQLSENVALQDGDTVFVAKAETFFVSGHVANPGSYVLAPGMTVLQALSLAGGVTDRGSTRRLKVVRVVDGEQMELDVELEDLVQPGDTIVVPQRFF